MKLKYNAVLNTKYCTPNANPKIKSYNTTEYNQKTVEGESE